MVCFDEGGAGALALVCLFLTSKSAYLKELGKIGFLPGLFNINEPIIFGAPIVMNPTLTIPFILSPMVMTVIAYLATITHLVPMTVSRTVFTVPSPIGAMMVTNWHIMAGPNDVDINGNETHELITMYDLTCTKTSEDPYELYKKCKDE